MIGGILGPSQSRVPASAATDNPGDRVGALNVVEAQYSYLSYEVPLLLVLTVVSGACAVAGGRRRQLRAIGWVLMGVTVLRAVTGALARMEAMGLRIGIPAPVDAETLTWIDGGLVLLVVAPSLVVLAGDRLGKVRRFRYWLHRLRTWRGGGGR